VIVKLLIYDALLKDRVRYFARIAE